MMTQRSKRSTNLAKDHISFSETGKLSKEIKTQTADGFSYAYI